MHILLLLLSVTIRKILVHGKKISSLTMTANREVQRELVSIYCSPEQSEPTVCPNMQINWRYVPQDLVEWIPIGYITWTYLSTNWIQQWLCMVLCRFCMLTSRYYVVKYLKILMKCFAFCAFIRKTTIIVSKLFLN